MAFMERLIGLLGKSVSWLIIFLVLVMCVDVFLRYGFNTSNTWMIDLEWQSFSVFFLLGAAPALLTDRHVRVDLIYERFPAQRKALVDALGTLVFLLPWCLVMLWTQWDYLLVSWAIGEGSPDPNGLPARYIVKAAIFLGFLLLTFASIIRLTKDLMTLWKPKQVN